MSLLPPTWALLQGRQGQRAAGSNQHAVLMCEPLSHLNCERHTPGANRAQVGHWAPPPGAAQLWLWVWLPFFWLSGLVPFFWLSSFLSGLIVYLNTVLWHVRMCQLSHKSCSPMSMHFAKISKMKTPQAWAPRHRTPVGPCCQTLNWALELGKSSLGLCLDSVASGWHFPKPTRLYSLCHDPK